MKVSIWCVCVSCIPEHMCEYAKYSMSFHAGIGEDKCTNIMYRSGGLGVLFFFWKLLNKTQIYRSYL